MSTQLQQLETNLSKSGKYEDEKNEAAARVRDFFLAMKDPEPDDEAMVSHYLCKPYFNLYIDISQPREDIPRNDLEEAFYEYLDMALFARYRNQTDASEEFFDKAKQIRDKLNDTFIDAYHDFIDGLGDAQVPLKLKLDMCYDLINKELEKDRESGMRRIGTALSLADMLADAKRKLDLLSKCQYVLYEGEDVLHTGLSLGEYILSEAANYATVKIWTHFHNGNIWLDLAKNDPAKKEYETAMQLAEKNQFDYAIMTMHERLGLVNCKMGQHTQARQHYDKSLQSVKTEFTKPWLMVKNRVRCLIGLGLVELETARTQTETERKPSCRWAENYFRQAADLAERINYRANEAVALSNLGDLHRFLHGDSNADAKRFHQRSLDINTHILRLKPTVQRVKWDKKYC